MYINSYSIQENNLGKKAFHTDQFHSHLLPLVLPTYAPSYTHARMHTASHS